MVRNTLRFLILINISLLFIVGCTNNSSEEERYVEPILEPYIEEFREDCEEYGWDPDHVDELNIIAFGDPDQMEGDDLQGVCYTNKGEIYLNANLYYEGDTKGIKHVLYHEFGHWYGLGHSSSGIMKSGYCTCSAKEGKEWEKQVKKMMRSK